MAESAEAIQRLLRRVVFFQQKEFEQLLTLLIVHGWVCIQIPPDLATL